MGRRPNAIIGAAIGGGVYGLIEKSFPDLPSLPMVGKSGTVAAICYFIGGRSQIIRDTGIAAAAIAGYSLAKEGKVSGPDDEHGLYSET